MDVLLTVSTTCGCCGTTGKQPVTPAVLGFDGDAGPAALDGLATERGSRRGLQLCASCGLAAPSLARAPRGARAVLAGETHRRALGHRCTAAAGRPGRDDATRWLAYAEGFAALLPPEAAGIAWAHAAAELEQPHLLPLGAREAQPAPDEAAAAAARHAAVARLMPLFEAEFAGARLPRPVAALRRVMRRLRLGERVRRPAAWRVEGHAMADRRAEGRFELACLLVDLLRRVGEFGTAESVALRALHDSAVPARLAPLLGHQLRLARSRDDARHELGSVRSTVVALPVPAPQDALPAALPQAA